MAFLQIKPGAEVTMKILDSMPVKQVYHWVDGRSVLCAGQGCHLCRQGKQTKVRYIYNVEVDGQTYKWEFGTKVLKQLISYAEDPTKRQGAIITVRRLGSGLQTQYVVTSFRGHNNSGSSNISKLTNKAEDDVRCRTSSKEISEFVEDAMSALKNIESALIAIKRILEEEGENEG